MSATPDSAPPSSGADFIAAALLDDAALSREHRRMYLRGIWGVSPEEIFAALAKHLSPDVAVEVETARGTVTLDAITLQRRDPAAPLVLVPYLVGPATARNRGSAGFAAVLRDEVTSGGAPRVLLILDREPLETVRTAAEDAADLPSLRWPALVAAAASGANPACRPVLDALIADHGRLPRRGETLMHLAVVAAAANPSRAGALLYRLGVYISDPDVGSEPVRRLREAANWRDKLESWSAPDKDFERLLRRSYPDPDDPGAGRVAAARGPFGLDYTRFTRADLPAAAPSGRLRFAQPLRVRGAAFASSSHSLAAWLPGGGAIGIVLTGVARGSDRATVRWSSGATQELDLSGDAREVLVRTPEDGVAAGWQFGEVSLGSGASVRLAIADHQGDWFPVEADVSVDIQTGAFVSAEAPRVLCIDSRSTVVGSAALAATSADPDGVTVYTAALGPASHPIPVLSLVRGDGDPDDEDSDGDEDDAPRDDDPGAEPPSPDDGPPAPPGGIEPPVLGGRVTCVPLALLEAARRGAQDVEPTFSVADGSGWVTLGNLHELEAQDLRAGDGDLSPLDGLAIETWLLDHPEVTAAVATSDGSRTNVTRDATLDRLSLDALDRHLVDGFLEARRDLFAKLRPRESVHALGAGVARAEAVRYVAAYQELLDSLDADGPFQAEYERLLLCDAVTDAASGDILLAPTNPVTVAWLVGLTDAVAGWRQRASEVLPADVAALSPRHLLPTFARGNGWFESVGGGPLLWRRFRAGSGTSAGTDSQHDYIARRIQHFLRIYPHYADARQVLSLTFHEPGSGEPVLRALRNLFAGSLDDDGVHLPKLAVTIVTSSNREGPLERILNGTAPVPARSSEADIYRAMRDRVRVTVLPPGTELPYAHLAFVFRSPLQRAPGVVDLDGRSTTLWAGGLAASPGRYVQPGRNETSFSWGTFTGATPSGALGRLVRATLQVVGGMPREHLASGKTRMPSTRVASAFLTEVYGASVWVVHLDRLLGLEAFAPDATGTQARYLIDYEDRADPAQPGLDAITATERIAPYRLALRRGLAGLGTPTDEALDRLLRRFNSVSGQWALDMVRVGTELNDLHERVGLAAAIAACHELDAGFQGDGWCGVMVPVKELLDSLPRGLHRPPGQHCDDLLYLRIPLDRRPVVVSGRLLEVKFRTSSDAASPHTARTQLEATRAWLDRVFNGDGPGRPFRSRDLAELLRGAVTRGESFGLLRVPDRRALERGLETVAAGEFRLDLSYEVGGAVLGGDFISVEADSSVAAHRQPLDGSGLKLGHVRLGRPVLEALASGRPLPRPSGWAQPCMPPQTSNPGRDEPRPQPDGPASGAGTPAGSASQAGGRAPVPASASPAETTPTHAQRDSAPPTDAAPAWTAGADEEVAALAPRLDGAFTRYGLSVEPFDLALVQVGPSLLRFRTRALGRLSITDVERRARDITREVGAAGEVSVGDEPGFITVDVPRSHRQPVPLGEVLPALDRATAKPGALNFVTGLSPSGDVRVSDLSRLPHLLVAGATGSGKSVFLRGLLVELLRARTPEELGLLIVDPKRLDFAAFARAPHLRGGRVIHEPDEALETLRDTLEMELAWRQPILEGAGVSSASEYYEAGGRLEDLPQLVILVDEFADLVLSGSDRKSFSEMIQRYAQLTRAYGIFLVLATQRPSVDVITGSIKANLTARIAFSLPSSRDSMTVLDRPGAQDLLGDGDLLFYSNGRVERLQAPFTSAADIRGVLQPPAEGGA